MTREPRIVTAEDAPQPAAKAEQGESSTLTAGLKEWAVVCRSLGLGLQTFIVRAGGIHEDGFAVEAGRFALLPTRFHEDESRLRPDVWDDLRGLRRLSGDAIEVRCSASVEFVRPIESVDAVRRLTPLQALSEAELTGRFEAARRGLILSVLRVRRLASPVILSPGEWSAGCRSWADLPRPIADTSEPVLSDAAFAEAAARAEDALKR